MSTNSTSTESSPSPAATSSTPTTSTDPASTSSPSPISSSSTSANSSPSPVSTTDSTTASSSSPTTSSSFIPSSSTSSTTSSSSPPSSTSFSSSSSSEDTTTTSSSTPKTTPPTTSSQVVVSTTITQTPASGSVSLITTLVTSTEAPDLSSSATSSSTASSSSSTGTTGLQTSGKSTSSGGLGTGGTIAVAVVVPIVAVALLVLAGLFLWRKRKARKDAEELRRKEVEEYGYNPNNDPTLPAVGSAGTDGPFEMREDGSSGYRGWGTTAVASSGRKASTTLSGGHSAGGIGMAYSEGTSPTHGPVSDTRSENPLVDGHPSGEQEALGVMGPAASANRSGDINRGPSNASSSYSAANRSDGSGEAGAAYYNNQYDTGNPYSETAYGSPPGRAEMSGQPIIRDVQARRNTRIENPSHYPQQSAGISQNF